MIADRDGWNLVLAGLWNVAIFNLEWLRTHIFKATEISVEMSTIPGLPLRFVADGVMLIAMPTQMLLIPVQLDDEHLLAAEQKALKILELLPHTPMTGVGVNLKFMEVDPGEHATRCFEGSDISALGDEGYEIRQRTLKRTLYLDEQQINLSLTQRENAVLAELNFHHDAQSATQAADALRGTVLSSREIALSLLERVYGLVEES